MRRFRFTGLGLLVASQVVALLIAASVGFGARTNSTSLHIQVVNRTKDDAVEVVLDGRRVYAGRPMPHSLLEPNPVPENAGTYEMTGGSDHNLLVEVPAGRARGQLHWNSDSPKDQWLVIFWTPSSNPAKASGTITFSMQRGPAGAR